MPLQKPFIDTPEAFIHQQRRYFSSAEQLGKTDVLCPSNRDLRRVVSNYNGSVYLKLQAESGPYMLELLKGNFLKELKVVDEQPSDFAIDAAHTDKQKICINRVSYPKKFDGL